MCFFFFFFDVGAGKTVEIKSWEKERVTDEQQLFFLFFFLENSSLFFCCAAENKLLSDWRAGRAV